MLFGCFLGLLTLLIAMASNLFAFISFSFPSFGPNGLGFVFGKTFPATLFSKSKAAAVRCRRKNVWSSRKDTEERRRETTREYQRVREKMPERLDVLITTSKALVSNSFLLLLVRHLLLLAWHLLLLASYRKISRRKGL